MPTIAQPQLDTASMRSRRPERQTLRGLLAALDQSIRKVTDRITDLQLQATYGLVDPSGVKDRAARLANDLMALAESPETSLAHVVNDLKRIIEPDCTPGMTEATSTSASGRAPTPATETVRSLARRLGGSALLWLKSPQGELTREGFEALFVAAWLHRPTARGAYLVDLSALDAAQHATVRLACAACTPSERSSSRLFDVVGGGPVSMRALRIGGRSYLLLNAHRPPAMQPRPPRPERTLPPASGATRHKHARPASDIASAARILRAVVVSPEDLDASLRCRRDVRAAASPARRDDRRS